jgi:cell division protein FtsB
MKELFDLLGTGERKILVSLCILLAVALIFHQGFALKKKKAYSFSVETLPNQQREIENIEESNKALKMELSRWDEARQDIEEIGDKYFYKEDKNINQLRLDLRKIFRTTGIRIVSDKVFDWSDFAKEKLKVVHVQFAVAGPYVALKRFIHQVEIHPKFLMIDKITFRDIDTQTGRIELQIQLAGYYEN